MSRFYEPDLGAEPDSPFARDASNKLVRRSYWLDMNDRSLVMVMTNGIGAHLTNDEKRAHLIDLKRDHLIEKVCVQEILPPEKSTASVNKAVLLSKGRCFVRTGVRVGPITSKGLKQKLRTSKSKRRKAARRSSGFKSDSWYAGAALSISIKARPKPHRARAEHALVEWVVHARPKMWT